MSSLKRTLNRFVIRAPYSQLVHSDGAVRFRKDVKRQVDASVARDAALLHAIETSATSVLNKIDFSYRRDRAFVQELFNDVPDGVDSKTAAIAVLCAAVCAMHGPYNRMVPTALLLLAICILSRSAERSQRTMVSDVTYSANNSVTLLDALDRTFVLPIELCATRDVSIHVDIEKGYIC